MQADIHLSAHFSSGTRFLPSLCAAADRCLVRANNLCIFCAPIAQINSILVAKVTMPLGQLLVPGPASVRLQSRSLVQAFSTTPPGPLRRPAIAQSQFSQSLFQNICRRHGQEVSNMCGQLFESYFLTSCFQPKMARLLCRAWSTSLSLTSANLQVSRVHASRGGFPGGPDRSVCGNGILSLTRFRRYLSFVDEAASLDDDGILHHASVIKITLGSHINPNQLSQPPVSLSFPTRLPCLF